MPLELPLGFHLCLDFGDQVQYQSVTYVIIIIILRRKFKLWKLLLTRNKDYFNKQRLFVDLDVDDVVGFVILERRYSRGRDSKYAKIVD
jgi:hypothetical protein